VENPFFIKEESDAQIFFEGLQMFRRHEKWWTPVEGFSQGHRISPGGECLPNRFHFDRKTSETAHADMGSIYGKARKFFKKPFVFLGNYTDQKIS
jgi:hypothetical protein